MSEKSNHEEIGFSVKSLDAVRDEILNALLFAISFFALLPLTASLNRIAEIGWQDIMYFHILSYAVIVTTTIFYRKLRYQYKATVIVSFCFLIGCIATADVGLIGSGVLFMIFSVIFATMFFDIRYGIVLIVIGLILLIVIAYGFQQNWIVLNFSVETAALSFSSWISKISVFALFSTFLIFSLGRLINFLVDSSENLKEHTIELEKINDKIMQEISEKKQAEQQLKASEARYRSLVTNMHDIVHSISTDGTILFIGPQVKRYGFTDDELVSQPFASFVLPEDLGAVRRDFQHTLLTGEQMITTFRIAAKDGSIVWFEETGQVVRDANGNIYSISGLLRDVTEKKRAEEALRDSERKLHAIFDHHYQLTGLIDAEGRILAANRTALRFADAKEPEVIGQYFWDGPWWDKSQRTELRNAVKRAVKGEFVRFETTHPTADGQIRNIDFSLSPVRDENGDVIYVVPEGRDITEIKRTEQEKAMLQEQLQQAQRMEAIGTLAGGIAHDFNNILSPILIQTEMALLDLPSDSPIRLNLEDVLEAGQRARELVKQILAFSRQGEEERHPVRIRPIIKDALRLLRASLPTTIEIYQDLESESDTVLADPTQIHQVLMNLCTNASHAMRSNGGLLQVRLDNVILKEKTTEIQDLNPGSYLRLTVSDTGEGIDEAVLDRIFDPYFTTKDKGEGTGLGLAVVHGIVKSYEGAITVDSERGKGTIFQVYFPLSESRDLANIETRGPIPKGDETILLVDDEKAIIDAVQHALELLGYQVIASTSSIEALEVFRSRPEKFDLVITDQTMPNMTGEDLTRELFALRPDTPIILCTGFSEIMNEEKAKAIGIQEFIMKPIIISELAKAIRKVLDKSK